MSSLSCITETLIACTSYKMHVFLQCIWFACYCHLKYSCSMSQLHNFFPFAGRIAFTFMNYGHQWVHILHCFCFVFTQSVFLLSHRALHLLLWITATSEFIFCIASVLLSHRAYPASTHLFGLLSAKYCIAYSCSRQRVFNNASPPYLLHFKLHNHVRGCIKKATCGRTLYIPAVCAPAADATKESNLLLNATFDMHKS